MIYEIVILAMIAAFLGLRLYSVLGRRAEHEEEPVPTRFDQPEGQKGLPRRAPPSPTQPSQNPLRQREFGLYPPALDQGLRAIVAADRQFDIASFLEGAKTAYGMILEAFWAGDKETLRSLCDDDVYEGFSTAIEARLAAGETLENRLVRIEEVEIRSASLDGRMARIAVGFNADIAAVTRDKDGNVIAGSLHDAVESRDVWTFMRDVTSPGPNWLLDETDEG
ncbi:MAG TPA: Tim44/TimA family putative adaptor protein [Sphingomonadaceae bacterium]|nr:Tim44/TimA family putative adaptor protein [Sphingomonadaceae bacterium]